VEHDQVVLPSSAPAARTLREFPDLADREQLAHAGCGIDQRRERPAPSDPAPGKGTGNLVFQVVLKDRLALDADVEQAWRELCLSQPAARAPPAPDPGNVRHS